MIISEETAHAPSHALAARLIREIKQNDLKPGQKLEGLRTLARRYKVSVATVRHSFRLLAKGGHIVARHGSGTFVAPNPSLGRHVAIFSEFDYTQPNCSHFFRRVPQALRILLQDNGIASRIYFGLSNEGKAEVNAENVCGDFFHDIKADRLSGVIEFNSERLHDRLRAAVADKNLPHVPHNYACIDYARMRAEGFQRLRELGCRRVAVLGQVVVPWGTEAPPDILAAEFAGTGLVYKPEWCRGDLEPKLPGTGWEMFREIWAARREKPDGLLVTDDVLFNDASKAILALGIAVPEKLRIVTHSNKGSGLFYPFPVDRLEVDPDAFAAILGKRMLKLLDGQDATTDSPVLHAKLITALAGDGIKSVERRRLQSIAVGSSRE